jgi:hypothetical protein
LRLPARETRLTGALLLHAVTIRRLRLTVKDGGVGCDSLRGYAFRAQCSCGWRGSRRDFYSVAIGDGRIHRLSEGFVDGESVR